MTRSENVDSPRHQVHLLTPSERGKRSTRNGPLSNGFLVQALVGFGNNQNDDMLRSSDLSIPRVFDEIQSSCVLLACLATWRLASNVLSKRDIFSNSYKYSNFRVPNLL